MATPGSQGDVTNEKTHQTDMMQLCAGLERRPKHRLSEHGDDNAMFLLHRLGVHRGRREPALNYNNIPDESQACGVPAPNIIIRGTPVVRIDRPTIYDCPKPSEHQRQGSAHGCCHREDSNTYSDGSSRIKSGPVYICITNDAQHEPKKTDHDPSVTTSVYPMLAQTRLLVPPRLVFIP